MTRAGADATASSASRPARRDPARATRLGRLSVLALALGLGSCANAGVTPSASSGANTVAANTAVIAHAHAANAAGFAKEIREQQAWLAGKTLSDGAIVYTATQIEPYYGNIAATGEIVATAKTDRARKWMQWYVAHLNTNDKWGLSGTIYDYRYDAAGKETPTNSADSVDSYAATFFTLARTLYDTGDPASQQYVEAIRPQLEVMGAMLLHVQQRDGMTIALPDYPVAYLMDNCEVYRGLRDLQHLEAAAFGDGARANRYGRAAGRVAAGIASLWFARGGTYDEEKQEPRGPATHSNWKKWYPDATGQLFPVLQGVISARSSRGRSLYAAFNGAYPHWDRLDFPDQFPWALVAGAAAAYGDAARVNAYAGSVEYRYSPGFAWPWYDLESGWYLRALAASQKR